MKSLMMFQLLKKLILVQLLIKLVQRISMEDSIEYQNKEEVYWVNI